MTPELRPDRWHSRDFPVLLEIARHLDEGASMVESRVIGKDLGLDDDQVNQAYEALIPGYAEGKLHKAMGHGVVLATATSLTERGRRATGLWPNEDDAADALVELLNQAADQVPDQDDASAIRRAGRSLRGVPAAVLADVTAALIRQQTGL